MVYLQCIYLGILINLTIGKWQPRYVMTDDSAIEQRAIRLAFPGLHVGEQEVDHLLCSVHSNRTLLRRLGSNTSKPIYQLLKHAMYCFTQIKNRELCEQVVKAASTIDNNLAKYVQTYWLQTAPKWAMYAWQHSPFLLQVTTTNACEAWHRKLKSGAGLSKGQVASHGIYGMILNIMDAAKDVDSRAKVLSFNCKFVININYYRQQRVISEIESWQFVQSSIHRLANSRFLYRNFLL